MLKKEQHCIDRMLVDIDQRLSAYRAGREDAKVRLRTYLHLATNAHAFYLACDDARRRLCNQAFFTKITLTENLDVRSEFTGVYETILDPPRPGLHRRIRGPPSRHRPPARHPHQQRRDHGRANRLHAEFWQRTGQLHPDINLDHNVAASGSPVIVPGIPAILIDSIVSTTLYTTIGIGVGALVRNQTAGIAIAVIWFSTSSTCRCGCSLTSVDGSPAARPKPSAAGT